MDDHLVANVASPERAVEKSAASHIQSVLCARTLPLQVGGTKAPHNNVKGAPSLAAWVVRNGCVKRRHRRTLVMRGGPRDCRRDRLKPVDSAWLISLDFWSVAANAKATKGNCCGVGDVSTAVPGSLSG